MKDFDTRRRAALDVLGAVLFALFVGAPLIVYFWGMNP